jgi:Putative lactococcus lactis phage r1t holin
MSRFWAATAERAGKTVAQTLLALWGGTALNALSINWATAAGLGLGAGILSVLTSVASLPVGPPFSPSLVQEDTRR